MKEQLEQTQSLNPTLNKKRRGFLNTGKVRAIAFYIISLCIIASVVTSILAIWDFANHDSLWRTIATCVVIAGACAVFTFVNLIFGSSEEKG